jgi:hypothetical protein
MYDNFLKRILRAYEQTGFRPQPRVWVDRDTKRCNPLVAIALHEGGEELFLSFGGRFYSSGLIRRWVMGFFRGNWMWVYGFTHAFDLTLVKDWRGDESYAAGYHVGREIRRRLKEIYYRKP